MRKYKNRLPFYSNSNYYQQQNNFYRRQYDNYDPNYMPMEALMMPMDDYADFSRLREEDRYEEENYEEENYEDKEYMKELYPEICKYILQWIKEECDNMDYEDSNMYAEYPDREMIEMIVERIYKRLKENGKVDLEAIESFEVNFELPEDISAMDRMYKKYNNWIKHLIKVMLVNEMYDRRRTKYKRKYKKTYSDLYDMKPRYPYSYHYLNPYRRHRYYK